MVRYILFFSYDGSSFYGYQKQYNKRSVQEEIENVLNQILNTDDIKLYSSGRTDKGVHAYSQVATFDSNKELDIYKFKHSLNKLLPKDIYIKKIERTKDDFYPRFETKYKVYEYLINNQEYDPLKRNYELFYPDFNKEKVQEIINLFIGKKNFQNFTSKEVDEDDFIRTIYEIKIEETLNGYKIIFKGDGFMRYEIRKIVGTFLAYSSLKITKTEIEEYLNNKEREIIPFQADAKGLYLKEVNLNDYHYK